MQLPLAELVRDLLATQGVATRNRLEAERMSPGEVRAQAGRILSELPSRLRTWLDADNTSLWISIYEFQTLGDDLRASVSLSGDRGILLRSIQWDSLLLADPLGLALAKHLMSELETVHSILPVLMAAPASRADSPTMSVHLGLKKAQ